MHEKLLCSAMNCAGFRWTSSLFKKQDSLNLASLGKEIIHSSAKARQLMRPDGVSFAIKNNLLGSIIPPSKGTERLLKFHLQTSAGLVSLISAYAPTLTSASKLKDRFYDDLSAASSKVPPQDPLFIFGDFSARVGADHSSCQLVWATLE